MAARHKQASVLSLTFELVPVPPFRLEYTAWALRRRSENLIDLWENGTYRRVLMLEGRPAEVCVSQSGKQEAPRLEITVIGKRLRPQTKAATARTLRHMLGLDRDLAPFYRMAASDSRLRTLAEKYRGLKPVRFPTVFEALANAIACQQFTLSAGLRLLGELARRAGVQVRTASGVRYAFPEPADLLRLATRTFRALGFSRQKALAFRTLSRKVLEGRFDETTLAGMDNEAAMEALLRLKGIGRWSAEYALLRGLGRLEIFPADDIGARNGLARWLGRKREMDYESVVRTLRPWRPYRGLIYFHLLLEGLRAKGELRER